MLKLINKLFKKNNAVSYTIAQYQPVRVNRLKVEVLVTHLQELSEIEHDEMEIDNLYKKN